MTYCSDECMEKDKQQTANKPSFLTQFDKGYGSARREKNIRTIIQMLQNGTTEDEIRFQLSMYFRPLTIDNYIETAKTWIRRMKQRVNRK